ncbi:Retrovirus-related Pol polyprotein from transposon RE1 [Vitis vinifera]|uniref:Retrovirus-related Pol polyprotein from transposon RE1 n=1 Tax=Vitis vinifera TaxID=29760 RepID=A0A438D3P5_VITVI|nr:Retrovirus-related Pol polyprotein from transposon RE1 [Vitis vinifera]
MVNMKISTRRWSANLVFLLIYSGFHWQFVNAFTDTILQGQSFITSLIRENDLILHKICYIPIRAPSATILAADGTTKSNPAYASWLHTDQTFLSLLYSSLTKESMSEVLGLRHSHEAWCTLEVSFLHRSKTCELQLKDELQLMQRGSQSIVEFSHTFKGLCDQLAAIGRPIDDTDKVHWYLLALGPDYKIFSTTMMSQLPLPSFTEIVSKTLSHEIFERSVSHSSSNSAYYVQQTSKFVGAKKWKNRPPPSSSSSAHLKSSSTIHCQLCDNNGYLAKCCWSFLKLKKKQSANIVEAFSTCSIQDLNDSEWFLDSGATFHMTSDTEVVDQLALYSGNERVMVGNGQSLAISHTSSISSIIPIRSQESYWESKDMKMVSTCWIVVIMPLCPPLLLHCEPFQNGIAECKHHHVTETGLTLMFHARVPLSLWVEAFSTTVFLINRLPSPLLDGKTPYELLFGKQPDYSMLRTFGDSPHLSSDPPPDLQGPISVDPSWILQLQTQLSHRQCLPFHALLALKEPQGFKSTTKHPEWLSAMDDEIQDLKTNDTWVLVPRPNNHNVVGCRWIFKTKL